MPAPPSVSGALPEASGAEASPLTAVRLLPSPFRDAIERDRPYLLDLDPDHLLSPYLLEAGLEPTTETLGTGRAKASGATSAATR